MEAEAETIEEIVADLRTDPILVHELLGNGDTAGTDARLTELAEDVGVPVYVALVQRPDDELATDRPGDDLLRQIHQELDEPGLYLVATPDTGSAVGAYGVDVPVSVVTHAAHLVSAEFRDDPEAAEVRFTTAGDIALTLAAAADPDGLTAAEAEAVLDSGPFVVREGETFEPSRYEIEDAVGEPLTPLVVGVVVGLTALPLAWRTLRARQARPLPRTPEPRVAVESIDVVRRRAHKQIRELRRALDAGDGDPLDAAGALESLDLAATLAGSDELLDVVGAYALALQGRSLLDGRSFSPCFYNPLHGEGVDRAQTRTSVPACPRCAARLARGEEPEALRDDGRPYFEGRSVWAETGFGALRDDLWRAVRTARR